MCAYTFLQSFHLLSLFIPYNVYLRLPEVHDPPDDQRWHEQS
jgi:hypothetical protein